MLSPTAHGAAGNTAAAGHYDLLTVVEHELGHVLGLADLVQAQNSNDLMYEYLGTSVRRLPGQGEAVGAVPGSLVAPQLQNEAPVDIVVQNPLPVGKTFEVFFDVTVNNPLPAGVTQVVNQGTFSYDETTVKSTDTDTVTGLPIGTPLAPSGTPTAVAAGVTPPVNVCVTGDGIYHLTTEMTHLLFCRWR